MGLLEYDDLSLYKNNIADIPWNKLEGVPENYNGDPTAINQGVVQIRCFIHPYCPFNKVSSESYDLVFNELTIPVINDILSDDAKNAFKATSGVEGIHFVEKYVYRHNYLYSQDYIDDGHSNPRTEFNEITGSNKSAFESVGETRYKEHQSWIIYPSVYDYLIQNNFELATTSASSANYYTKRCGEKAQWAYSYPTFDSAYSGKDELLDYKTDYYINNSKNYSKFRRGINTTNMQMPRQISTTDCLGQGVHWRVLKYTPLYRGEDFFVEFHRHAKSTVSNSTDKGSIIPFNDDAGPYQIIDAFGDQWADNTDYEIEVPGGDPVKIYVNRAVRDSEEPSERVAFRLNDQAYYVIEMGSPTAGDNGTLEYYFILITERSYPIFVMADEIEVEDSEGFIYGRLLSEFSGVHGAALINADRTRITVRNHLGKLVITFDIDGDRSEPWIIERSDQQSIKKLINNINSDSQNIEDSASIATPIVVPASNLILWGGNLLCGFTFGPLQYVRSRVEFPWPQQHSLPMNTKISARLTVSDEFIHDMARYQDVPGSPEEVNPLFTQQAHFFQQWGESDKFPNLGSIENGTFFYGVSHDPLIQLSPGREDPGVRDSAILLGLGLADEEGIVIDEQRHRQKFFLGVTLETGSHQFLPSGTTITDGWRAIASDKVPTKDNLEDDKWVVDSCKTPILTTIRLVAEPNEEPLWKDGTDATGYRGLPVKNNHSPYFRDVSHHVTSFTDSWSSSDFYEIEHTGSINFLLKPITLDPTGSGEKVVMDDSEYLKSLQDKTFYIEVWAGYDFLKNGEKEYTQLGGFYKLFTGLCYGGSVDKTYSREIMTCQVNDYKKILQDQKFFNSPFFDGMKDVAAVSEILGFAGFRSKGPGDPGRYIRNLKEDIFSSPPYYTTTDGRFFIDTPYALPSSYRRLEQPYFKFDAGSTYYDGIIKIAHNASKLFYFDQHGIAHFESYMDLIMHTLMGGGPDLSQVKVLFSFTSNHKEYPGQLIYNKVETQYRVEDVHNHLKIISATPNQELLIADDLRWESLDQPNVEGFLGYKKLFYQREGMLGSEGAVKSLINFYRVMFRPEMFVKFETHGLPIRATDFLYVDNQFLRVSKVSHDINADKNTWWMNVEGERMQFPQ